MNKKRNDGIKIKEEKDSENTFIATLEECISQDKFEEKQISQRIR